MGFFTPILADLFATFFLLRGNFWWGNSDYLATLDENFLYTQGEHGKIDRELMIGSGPKFDPYNIHHVHIDTNMYDTIFTEDNYI